MEIGYGRCSWRLFSSSIQSSGTECACTLTAKDAAKTISQRPRILQKTNAPARSNVLAQCIDWGARSKIDANIGTENNQPKRSQQSARIVSSTSPMQRLKLTESRERVGCVKFGIGGLLDPGERSADSWNSREVHFDSTTSSKTTQESLPSEVEVVGLERGCSRVWLVEFDSWYVPSSLRYFAVSRIVRLDYHFFLPCMSLYLVTRLTSFCSCKSNTHDSSFHRY